MNVKFSSSRLISQLEHARTVIIEVDLLSGERGLDLPVPFSADSVAILTTPAIERRSSSANNASRATGGSSSADFV